jgi:hypothetical protein
MVLASAAADGQAHLALLSRGEVLAVADDVLRIALHADSRTSANLARTGLATLLLVEPDGVETVTVRARSLGGADVGGRALAVFEARVTERREHAVPYATVTSGIAYELADEDATVARWQATIEVLRRAGP